MEIDNENLSSGVSLQEYLAILRRRRGIILQTFVVILVVGVVITLLTKPVYEASAQMLVDPPALSVNSVDASNPLSSLFTVGQQQSLDTQIQVLQAGPLMDQVTQQVGPAALSVSAVGDTNVLADVAQASTPKRAADAANLLLDLYITQDSSQSLSQIQTALKFVQTQGALAHKNLNDAEDALAAFKQKYHVADLTTDRSNQIANVSGLAGDYGKAVSDLTVLKAQMRATQSLLATQPASLPIKLAATNTEIQGIQDQIRALQVQRDGMMQPGGYTDHAYQIQTVDAQIAALQAKMKAEPALTVTQSSSPNAVRETLRGQLVTMQAQEATLTAQAAVDKAQLAQAQAQVGHFAGWEVLLDRLTRRRDAAQAQDTMFASQLTQLNLREKASPVSAHIIMRATPPDVPIRPKKAESILFAALIGLFIGLCLALLQEFLDDRINTTDDADRTLGLPALGHVPALTATDAKLLPQMKGLDPASESYRVLRTNIHFASVDTPTRTLVVTSSAPGEGKTTTAANLAFAMAADGRRVILVDTDLRRPSLHTLLELPAVPGLTDVLLGKATLNEALLDHESMEGLSVLTCGSTPPNPSELLGSRTFRNLVGDLMEISDLVIFDSPPVLAASDAQILASQMDGTILVIEAGQTKKASAKRTLALLRQARANVMGVAYNKMSQTDTGDYLYYQYSRALPEATPSRNGHSSTTTAALLTGATEDAATEPKKDSHE
jgi:succinoglycan biosynthesis transport protein ExoP